VTTDLEEVGGATDAWVVIADQTFGMLGDLLVGPMQPGGEPGGQVGFDAGLVL
jgi:hypothetical protein